MWRLGLSLAVCAPAPALATLALTKSKPMLHDCLPRALGFALGSAALASAVQWYAQRRLDADQQRTVTSLQRLGLVLAASNVWIILTFPAWYHTITWLRMLWTTQ